MLMSCFRLSNKLGKEISSSMAKFWWVDTTGDKSIQRLSWNKLTNLKCQGGLGFKDLQCFNIALLAKQLWRFITNPNLLVSKILKFKYFEKGSNISIGVHRNAS